MKQENIIPINKKVESHETILDREEKLHDRQAEKLEFFYSKVAKEMDVETLSYLEESVVAKAIKDVESSGKIIDLEGDKKTTAIISNALNNIKQINLIDGAEKQKKRLDTTINNLQDLVNNEKVLSDERRIADLGTMKSALNSIDNPDLQIAKNAVLDIVEDNIDEVTSNNTENIDKAAA